MTRPLFAGAIAAVFVLQVIAASAQESPLHAELRLEGAALQDQCFENIAPLGCATTLFTDHPLHVAVGSLAPQNGFGFGPAFVWHRTPSENWRWQGSVDGAWAPLGGAWRVGTYLTITRTAVDIPQVVAAGTPRRSSTSAIHPYPVLKLYAQTISLPTVSYFGIGPDTNRSDEAVFGLRESVIGTSAIWPVITSGFAGRLNLSLLGEITGRLMSVRAGSSGDVPSVEQRYTDATAPGLSSQPGTVQFGEGLSLAPSLLNGRVQLNYEMRYQQFIAPTDATASFQRWTVDLRHNVPLFGSSPVTSRDTNDPNACATGPTTTVCPSISRNGTGTVTVRALLSRSMVSGAAAVPFYFQETLGGSDLDGNRMLPSYDDYRFRGPQVVLFQESLEHSILGSPVGLWLSADEGKVGQQHDRVDFTGLRHSVAIGATIRAGGLPFVLFTFATGGPEGHHIAVTMSPSLLGGGRRPSLQ